MLKRPQGIFTLYFSIFLFILFIFLVLILYNYWKEVIGENILFHAPLDVENLKKLKKKKNKVSVNNRRRIFSGDIQDLWRNNREEKVLGSNKNIYVSFENKADISSEFEVSKYKVFTNSGGGDCFFYAVRQYLESLKIKCTVKELRIIVAESMQQKDFEELKAMVGDDPERSIRISHGHVIGANNLEEMRANMLKSSYWADECAIKAIENYFTLKFIILMYLPNNKLQISIREKDEENSVKKKRYIFLRLSNLHYELISYGGRVFHSYSSLPLYVKRNLI